MTTRSPLAHLSHRARALWAKSGDLERWLALPQHMIDAADAAGHLWREWATPQLRRECAAACGLDEAETERLLRWLAAVHDIGKASRHFAGALDKAARLDEARYAFAARVRDAGLPMTMPAQESSKWIAHGTASGTILRQWLISHLAFHPRAATRLADIADAHHGRPSRVDERAHAQRVLTGYEPEWVETWHELIEFASEYTEANDVLSRLQARGRRALTASAQMRLCGLVIMADWIASSTEAFPLTVDPDQARRAAAGYAALDLPPPWRAQPSDTDEVLMRDRFAWPGDARPRPVQAVAAATARALEQPALIIIEAPTGEGKTEAALVAAELCAARLGSGGIFFGAPTMATSDALFHRILRWATRAVPSGEVSSMFLGHSRAALNEEYRGLRHAQVNVDDDAEQGSIVAAQWLAGRKKGLLSNMVVGTVDQLLMLALQAKHSMLRHVAFAGKVVVVDEVHAYDAYMNEYLAMALEWLAEFGVSVILLSATLPAAAKRRLLTAYANGCGGAVPAELGIDYPLVSVLPREGALREIEVKARPPDAHVAVGFMADDTGALVEQLAESTTAGGCVLVLCNSVVRAQQAFDALTDALHEDAVLLHARFVAADRLGRERRLVSELGPAAHRGAGRPHRRIIVATQVAEQSLDIDVDLLITDIAPMDLVLQRMGRLHRHRRPESDRPSPLATPRMLVRGVMRIDPVPVFDRHAVAIYGERMLLASLAGLLSGPLDSGITRPDDVPSLVQAAYSDAPLLPPSWAEAWTSAESEFNAQRASSARRAETFRIPSPADAPDIASMFSAQNEDVAANATAEERGYAQVRDTDPSLEAVIIIDDGDGYRPLEWLAPQCERLIAEAPPSESIAAVLARSTVRLPPRFGRYHFEETLDQLEQQTPIGWQYSPLLRGFVALRLDAELTATLCGRTLVYGQESGLAEVTR